MAHQHAHVLAWVSAWDQVTCHPWDDWTLNKNRNQLILFLNRSWRRKGGNGWKERAI